jgi:hypothetical protein
MAKKKDKEKKKKSKKLTLFKQSIKINVQGGAGGAGGAGASGSGGRSMASDRAPRGSSRGGGGGPSGGGGGGGPNLQALRNLLLQQQLAASNHSDTVFKKQLDDLKNEIRNLQVNVRTEQQVAPIIPSVVTQPLETIIATTPVPTMDSRISALQAMTNFRASRNLSETEGPSIDIMPFSTKQLELSEGVLESIQPEQTQRETLQEAFTQGRLSLQAELAQKNRENRERLKMRQEQLQEQEENEGAGSSDQAARDKPKKKGRPSKKR